MRNFLHRPHAFCKVWRWYFLASPQSAVCFFFGRPFLVVVVIRHRHLPKSYKKRYKKKKKNNIIHSPGNDTTTGTRDAPTREYRRKFREADLSERDFCTGVAHAQEREERERGRVFAKEVKSRYRQKNVVSNFSLTPPLPALSRPLPGRKDGKPIGKNRAAFRALREARRARKTKRGARWVGRIDLVYFTSVFGVVFGSKDRFRSAFSKRAISHFLSNQLPPSNFYRVVLVQSLKK